MACHHAKVHQHTKSPLEPFPILARLFNHVHVNLVSPRPSSQGFKYSLTMVDWTTEWSEAVPLSSTTSSDVAPVSFLLCRPFRHSVRYHLRQGSPVNVRALVSTYVIITGAGALEKLGSMPVIQRGCELGG